MSQPISIRAEDPTARRISLAILAMGGQGGGVLADWIVALAEAQGWAAQSTSVPGVAQRTGATTYHIEMVPAPLSAQSERTALTVRPFHFVPLPIPSRAKSRPPTPATFKSVWGRALL